MGRGPILDPKDVISHWTMTVRIVGVYVWGLLYLTLHFGSFGWFGQVQCIRISLLFELCKSDFTAQILFSSGVVGRLNLWFPSWWLLASSVSKPESNCLISDSTHKLKGDQVNCGSTSRWKLTFDSYPLKVHWTLFSYTLLKDEKWIQMAQITESFTFDYIWQEVWDSQRFSTS